MPTVSTMFHIEYMRYVQMHCSLPKNPERLENIFQREEFGERLDGLGDRLDEVVEVRLPDLEAQGYNQSVI